MPHTVKKAGSFPISEEDEEDPFTADEMVLAEDMRKRLNAIVAKHQVKITRLLKRRIAHSCSVSVRKDPTSKQLIASIIISSARDTTMLRDALFDLQTDMQNDLIFLPISASLRKNIEPRPERAL